MVDALWSATLGYALDQLFTPTVGRADASAARRHARDHLRPAGHHPCVQVGRQPYGVLPIVAPSHVVPAAPPELARCPASAPTGVVSSGSEGSPALAGLRRLSTATSTARSRPCCASPRRRRAFATAPFRSDAGRQHGGFGRRSRAAERGAPARVHQRARDGRPTVCRRVRCHPTPLAAADAAGCILGGRTGPRRGRPRSPGSRVRRTPEPNSPVGNRHRC